MNSNIEISRKDWDSDFFKREIFSLEIINDFSKSELFGCLEELDGQGVWGIECHLDSSKFEWIPLLEEAGFRLVDSRATFITELSHPKPPQENDHSALIRTATDDDIPQILSITDYCFIEAEDRPITRFNNRKLFSEAEAREYYRHWITNNFTREECHCSVLVNEGEVVGYFLYELTDYEGAPLLKGLMVGIMPSARGHGAHIKLQQHIISRIGLSNFYLDNTTQLTNTAVLRNHVRSRRRLRNIQFTMYRKNG